MKFIEIAVDPEEGVEELEYQVDAHGDITIISVNGSSDLVQDYKLIPLEES